LVMPGILPSLARLRKQIRHILNFRMNPLRRPQIRQRLTRRVEYLGLRRAFMIIAFLAILFSARPYLRKGTPIRARRLLASVSVRAVVTIATFMPPILSILS
jgi:hypothetical protein